MRSPRASSKAFSVSFKPGPLPLEQNKYWQELNKRLNVNWQVTLPTGNEGYTEKAAALLASGDLGDIFNIQIFLCPSLAPSGAATRRDEGDEEDPVERKLHHSR